MSSAPEEPAGDAAAGQNDAPVQETEHAALVAAPKPEISPASSAPAAPAPKLSAVAAVAKAGVEPDRQGVRRERAMVRKMGRKSSEQTRAFETANFVRPSPQEEFGAMVCVPQDDGSSLAGPRWSPGRDRGPDEIGTPEGASAAARYWVSQARPLMLAAISFDRSGSLVRHREAASGRPGDPELAL